MINLDMKNKYEVRITQRAFTLENNILILEIDLGEYSLEGKTITAAFSPSKVETIPLTVDGSIVKIPIHSTLVQYGINYIQLNFRWDNKLEQSGIMVWKIEKSLETTAIAQENIDIITHLVDIATQAKNEADTLIENVQTKLENGEFKGNYGASAYEVWLSQGNVGTEEDFLASLKGESADTTQLTQEVTTLKEDFTQQKDYVNEVSVYTMSVTRVNGLVTEIKELDGTTEYSKFNISRDANGKVLSTTKTANGKSIKSIYNKVDGKLVSITKEVL